MSTTPPGRAPPETRSPALTLEPDAQDAARPDADRPPPFGTPPRPDVDDGAPGVGEAFGGTRAAAMRLLKAHVELARTELAQAGQQLGIIVGLAFVALALAMLMGILLYVGTFLFLGEWLFGSMGWGILHGALITTAFIGFIAVNLAGGQTGAYGWGAVVGAVVALALTLLFASNVLRDGAVFAARELEDAIALHPDLLPTLVGLAVGGALAAAGALLAGWRSGWRFGSAGMLLVAGLFAGGIVGAILGSVTFDLQGAAAVSVTMGLIAWLAAGFALAASRGFDPAARYARLVPRESIAQAEKTRDFLMAQWERQKGRLMGR